MSKFGERIMQIFMDSQGKMSSKRVWGAALIVAAVVSNLISAGDPATNQVMIYAGVAAIGVGTFETRVNKS